MEFQDGRRKSPPHEARWLNLLGYALRPGYGLAVDDWRVSQTWKTVQGKLAHAAATSQTESWILWRRLAGGLSAGQQRTLADPLLSAVRNLHRRLVLGKGGDFGFTPQQSLEMWRLLGSLELLGAATKIQLGDQIAAMFEKKNLQSARPAMVWALGRLGARSPVYGPLNTVPPVSAVKPWLDALMRAKIPQENEQLAVMQLARRTEDRYRDLPEDLRQQAADWLEDGQAPNHWIELVRAGGTLDQQEQGRVFGEALPIGLRFA